MRRSSFSAFVGLVLMSCSVEIPDGHFACTNHEQCPPEMGCDGVRCSRATPRSDAGPGDSGLDGAPRDGAPDSPVGDAGPDSGQDTGPGDAGPGDAGPGDTRLDAGRPGCGDFEFLVGGSGPSAVNAVALATDGRVFVAGTFSGVASIGGRTPTAVGPSDWFVAALERNGTLLHLQVGGAGGDDTLQSILLDEVNGMLYAAGSSATPRASLMVRMNLEDLSSVQEHSSGHPDASFSDIVLHGGAVLLAEEIVQGPTPIRARIVEFNPGASDFSEVRSFAGERMNGFLSLGADEIMTFGSRPGDGLQEGSPIPLRNHIDDDHPIQEVSTRPFQTRGEYTDGVIHGGDIILSGQRHDPIVETLQHRIPTSDPRNVGMIQNIEQGAYLAVASDESHYWFAGWRRSMTSVMGEGPRSPLLERNDNATPRYYRSDSPTTESQFNALAVSVACDRLYAGGYYSDAITSLRLTAPSGSNGFLVTLPRETTEE